MTAQEAADLAAKKRAEEEEYTKRVTEQVELIEEDDEEREQRLTEERRRRREEIKAKFKSQQQAAPVTAPSEAAKADEPMPSEEASANAIASSDGSAVCGNGGTAAEPRAEPSAGLASSDPSGDAAAEQHGEEGAAMADSDSEDGPAPMQKMTSADMTDEARQKDKELREYMLNHRRRSEVGNKAPKAAPAPAPVDAAEQGEAAEEEEEEEDKSGAKMFDMFTTEDVDEPEVALEEVVDEAAAMDRGDNYDDKEGYYAHRIGDILSERYKVLGSFGKGVFSTVVRCQDLRATSAQYAEVAIKVQRNNEMMRRAGEKEIAYLQRLVDGDPENKRHCIHMINRFDHEDHLCMVFEAMHQNLRQAVRQHGHKRGIQVEAVRAYGRQLFTALKYMERLGIVHADLKPDNIVVNDKYNLLKVCDFGSACNADDNEITPYLVSRFYRAPEIMMGLQFGCPIDMWAAGLTLFELYTGKIAFMGQSNNQMLKLIQEVKGKMPLKLIRKGFFSELHFDVDNDFIYKEKDKVSGREVIRTIKFENRPVPGHDLKSLLMPNKQSLPESEAKRAVMLADLLEKCLMLDPSKRMTPAQALKHPFCDLSRK